MMIGRVVYCLGLMLLATPAVALSPSARAVRQSSSECNAASTEVSSSLVDTRERNMFHEYDKPILLIGCSGPGDELKRAADAFQSDNFQDGGVVELSEMGQGSKIIQSVEEKSIGWPTVILVDFGDRLVANKDDKRCSELEKEYAEAIRTLYMDNHILSIYVNVHSEDSRMSDAASEMKKRIENDVFVQYSDYELCIRDEGMSTSDNVDWKHIQWELTRLVARARLIPAIPGDTARSENSAHLTMGEHTFFLSLSFPDISQVKPYVKDMCEDVDAMEYRADLLDCRDSRFDLIYGMQLLRKYCRPFVLRAPALKFGRSVIEDIMPIVYTVRTQNQAGTYPDDEEGINKMFNLLDWGLRAGSEVLDIESAWDKSKTDNLLSIAEQRYSSQILGSHHVVGKEVSTEAAVKLFQQCALNGRAHGAKVVLSIESDERDRMAYEAASIASSLAKASNEPVIPNISLILGNVGKYSRVLNFPFTPVTHESLPFKAAPGQLTASQIMTVRLVREVLKKKVYAILGHNIAYSVSPQMHGAAFGTTRLPHKYVRADVPTVEEFVESDFFQGDSFGGCSVTIPHKQAIIPYVDVLSDAADAIGSCNTLIAKDEVDVETNSFKRIIHGDNTDWKGIFNPLKRLLVGGINPKYDYALILGAGGTARAAAYVARKLGLQRAYFNRTPEKAKDLEESFGGVVLSSLEEGGDENSLGPMLQKHGGSVRVVISTLPAAAGFTLPDWLIASKPVVFDVNYKPFNTDLLLQANSEGCDVVRGSEMLWEQGIGQFELWTKRTAPYKVMKAVVEANCKPPSEDTQ